LADAEATLHRERMIAAFSLATALLLGALAAALALPRSRTRAGAAGPVAPTVPLPLHAAAAPPGAESEQPTADLLQRLRRQDVEATRPPSQEPQP
jgi:hypothetical protein